MIILKNILKTYLTVLQQEGFAEINYKLEEDENININFVFFNEKTRYSFSVSVPYSSELDEITFDSLTAINTLDLIKISPQDSLFFDINRSIILSSEEMIIVVKNFLNNMEEQITIEDVS